MTALSTRGRTWFDALRGTASALPGLPHSVLASDARLGDHPARLVAVVPDPASPYPRARQGEVGLREGWALAQTVRDAMAQDARGSKRLLLAIVDVPSQAYGRREEMLGIHLACAAAVDAYASARMAGHPVIALLVGAAMSGAFLAHGYQAHRILALDDARVMVHAMGREAAARVTRRSVDELDQLGTTNPPMSYRITDYARLGLLHDLIAGIQADAPTDRDVATVRQAVLAALASIGPDERDLAARLTSPTARTGRAASCEVRERLAEQW
ncbi:Malonate decarboxylase, gamma subunit [Thiomonas sp. X19]|uniref:biotin-independent malonate decarboxylase subunit gamma n=1 Tax=Thiomonas sp. X19 TaxID=1050370 RepID=UPI000B749851|nr:biotin-independent malonate decarboxylase subunit gamma [Thiomonas sp. X19]SCC94229.1 Malonate decarboxylase, gamma subunit [Thiomonas sp. X19]